MYFFLVHVTFVCNSLIVNSQVRKWLVVSFRCMPQIKINMTDNIILREWLGGYQPPTVIDLTLLPIRLIKLAIHGQIWLFWSYII